MARKSGYSTRIKMPRPKTEKRIKMPQPVKRPLQFQTRTLIRHKEINRDPWWLVIHRRGIRRPKVGEDELEARAVPHSMVRGTLPERILYKALVDRLHFIPDIDFDMQSSLQGGRIELGGIVADFMFKHMMLVIQVQGPTHEEYLRMRKDSEQELVLNEMGYQVISIWEATIYDEFALDEWLNRNLRLRQTGDQSDEHDFDSVWLNDTNMSPATFSLSRMESLVNG